MKKTLTKTDHVRAILKRLKRASFYKILNAVETRMKQVIGRAHLYALLAELKYKGEIDTDGRGDDAVYFLVKK